MERPSCKECLTKPHGFINDTLLLLSPTRIANPQTIDSRFTYLIGIVIIQVVEINAAMHQLIRIMMRWIRILH